MPDLRKQPGPFRGIRAVLGENVGALTVGYTISKLGGSALGVPVQEGQVDAVLAAKMPHGTIYAGANDVERALVVAELVEPELAARDHLQQVEHRNALASQAEISGHTLTFCGAV